MGMASQVLNNMTDEELVRHYVHEGDEHARLLAQRLEQHTDESARIEDLEDKLTEQRDYRESLRDIEQILDDGTLSDAEKLERIEQEVELCGV